MTVQIKDLKFLLIYVDELELCQAYYEKYFGFEKTAEFGPGEIYGKAGDIEMWIGAGYQKNELAEKSVRASVMIGVDSVGALFEQLKVDNQPMIHDQPNAMQPGTFWLQVVDPAGNILDILGGE